MKTEKQRHMEELMAMPTMQDFDALLVLVGPIGSIVDLRVGPSPFVEGVHLKVTERD